MTALQVRGRHIDHEFLMKDNIEFYGKFVRFELRLQLLGRLEDRRHFKIFGTELSSNTRQPFLL